MANDRAAECESADTPNAHSGTPTIGAHVKVLFGSRVFDGVVIRETITGRYTVQVNVPGADSPVISSYDPSELRTAS